MSRRITLFALAASAALIATQASADRECFENSCRLPDAAAPPVTAAEAPVPETASPDADAAQAATPQAVAPQVAATPEAASTPQVAAVPRSAEAHAESKLAPGSALPQVVAEPAPRLTPPQASTRLEEARVRREPVRVVAPRAFEQARPAPAPARVADAAPQAYARGHRPRVEANGYTMVGGIAPIAGTMVVVAPAYAGYRGYMIAPNAKIISLDAAD